jgi:non-ribosomal peptide synthase protein (TIGR01720 family)
MYMVPSAYGLLDRWPLTSHGKLDRAALPALDRRSSPPGRAYAAPQTPVEALLANLWAESLRVERVGRHDNFFELGGDSILGIQVVARAKRAGLHLLPRQLFEYPTLAELAAAAGALPGPAAKTSQGEVVGEVPLTPIQHWFFEQFAADPAQWTQLLWLEARAPLEPRLLEHTLAHLLRHHDALRLQFLSTEAGWRQVNLPPADITPLTVVDISAVALEQQQAQVHSSLTTGWLSLSEGVLLRGVLFERGAGRPHWLLLAAHALAVDGVSRRILAEDLQTAYDRLRRGEGIALPPKTTSFQAWAGYLQLYAQSRALQDELPHWLVGAHDRVAQLPRDHPEGRNTPDSARVVPVLLDADETHTLLHRVPAAYHTQTQDVLVTALAQALAAWLNTTAFLIDVRGHGREPLFDHIDLSRTVGWLTTLFPVWLTLPNAASPGEALKAVKEQLRQVPGHGLGYGVLRYLCPQAEVRDSLGAQPQAEVSFNYLGQFDQMQGEPALFADSDSLQDPASGLWGTRYLLEIQGGVTGNQLRLAFKYSANIHHHSTVERLAQEFGTALRSLIAHCRSAGTGGYTPSDFPRARLSQQALDQILASVKGKSTGTGKAP